MRSHLLARLIVAAALLAGAMTGLAVTASSAAAIQQCTGGYARDNNYSVSGTTINVTSYNECTTNPALSMPEPVSVSKFVGNVGWEVVATGTGVIFYSCTGGQFLYTTNITTAENKPAFYCG